MESTRQRYVAFLDILGFKQLVRNTKHENLHKLYSDLFITNAAMAVANGAYKIENAGSRQVAVPDFANAKIQCMVISDSALMYTQDDSMQSLLDLCVSAGKLLMMGFFIGLPMRGSISLGPLSVFNQKETDAEFGVHGLVGMALVSAYSDESTYDWAGCVISPECIARYESLHLTTQVQGGQAASIKDVVEHGMILRYPAPRKGLPPSDQWAINWPRYNRTPLSDQLVRDAFEKHGKDAQNESVQSKVRNTLEFLAHSNSAAFATNITQKRKPGSN